MTDRQRAARVVFLYQYANAYAILKPYGFVWCDCEDCSRARRALEVASGVAQTIHERGLS